MTWIKSLWRRYVAAPAPIDEPSRLDRWDARRGFAPRGRV